MTEIAKSFAAYKQEEDGETTVELTPTSLPTFFHGDIVRHRLTGTFPVASGLQKVNFVECLIQHMHSDGVDYSECDFKDTTVRDCTFRRSKFDVGELAMTTFVNCVFESCSFYNTGVHNCEFRHTTFSECNLTNLIIKSSRFSHTTFNKCVTSNKLVEMSILNSTRFENMDIQIETVTGNFGLVTSNLDNCRIRSGRSREEHRFMETADLAQRLGVGQTPLEDFRLAYFLDSDLTSGSRYLDRTLDLASWTKVYRNAGSFVELLDGFSEFLLFLYEEDKLAIQPLLLLHYISGVLMTEIDTAAASAHRVVSALAGTHMILSRHLEGFFRVLQQLLASNSRLSFLVIGPNDISYYDELFAPWLRQRGGRISKLVVHNSPLEMGIIGTATELLPFVALFLSTRLRIEIRKLTNELPPSEIPTTLTLADEPTVHPLSPEFVPSAELATNLTSVPLLLFGVGKQLSTNAEYLVRLQSRLPGSLIIDLGLGVSTELIGRLRKVLLRVISATAEQDSTR